jgi:hypothetical protein
MEKVFDATLENNYRDTSTLFLLPGEIAVLTTKQHAFAIIPPVIIACILGIGAILISFIGGAYFHAGAFLIMITGSMIVCLTLGLIVKILVDWYFHLYLVTNRRILEISYKPFFSQDVNDVLLDQVRCTEIDVKIHGYIHGLMDVGDIIITFDRPTHQQEFILHDIKSPRTNGTLLGHLLNTPKDDINTQEVWYKEQGKTANYTFTKELRPKARIQIV